MVSSVCASDILLPDLDQEFQSKGCHVLNEERFHVSGQVETLFNNGFIRDKPTSQSWSSYTCEGESIGLVIFKFATKKIAQQQLGYVKVYVLGGSMTGSAHHPERIFRSNEHIIILSTRQRVGKLDGILFTYTEKTSPDHLFDIIENAIQCDRMDNKELKLCQYWEAFYKGQELGRLPDNYFTLGDGYTFDPYRSPIESYYALFAFKGNGAQKLDIVNVRPDDENESTEMGKYVDSIASKNRDKLNAIHQWLSYQMATRVLFEVTIARGAAIIEFAQKGRGTRTFVRQNGNFIYALEMMHAPEVRANAIYTLAVFPLDNI